MRPARPEDAGQLIELIHSSGPAAFDYGFACPGHSARDFLRFCFLRGRGLFGWDNHAVIERDGQVLGVGSFYTADDYPSLNRHLVRQMLAFFPIRHWPGVIRRALQLAALLPPPERGELYVANLGVRAEARGQGAGAALLAQQHQAAVTRGLSRAALDVAVDNPRAEALYTRLGYRVVSERRFRGPPGRVPDARRMQLPLAAE